LGFECVPGLSNRMIVQPCLFAGTCRSLMLGWGEVGCGGGGWWYGGPVQIACLGVESNVCSTQLVATAVEERPPQPTVHLAIIQACFTLSSRVLLVSNLRRSNWKCTVKRFFKSTVMLHHNVRESGTASQGGFTKSIKQSMDAN
jgi:hypothetical protein